MAASKKTRRSSAKKAARKSATAKGTPRKAAKTKKARAGKASPRAGDVVYSDLRKIALARALARR
jgi:hypothetical protein